MIHKLHLNKVVLKVKKFMKQKLTGLEGEIRQSHIMVRYFKISFSTNDMKPGAGAGRGVKKNTDNLNNSTNHHGLLIIIEYYTQPLQNTNCV